MFRITSLPNEVQQRKHMKGIVNACIVTVNVSHVQQAKMRGEFAYTPGSNFRHGEVKLLSWCQDFVGKRLISRRHVAVLAKCQFIPPETNA